MSPPDPHALIRSVVADDFGAWKHLWDSYNAFYARAGPTALPLEITKMTWSRFFDAYEPVHAMVAEKSGELLGLVHYLFHRSTIQITPTCYLQDLFTAEAVRGQGIGKAPHRSRLRKGNGRWRAAGVLAHSRNKRYGDAVI